MTIKQFLPIGVAAIAGFCAVAHKTEVPVAPIGAIATAGVFLLATQLEERRLGNFIAGVFRIFRPQHHV